MNKLLKSKPGVCKGSRQSAARPKNMLLVSVSWDGDLSTHCQVGRQMQSAASATKVLSLGEHIQGSDSERLAATAIPAAMA